MTVLRDSARIFLKNVFGLGSMQVAQYLLPFLTVPYLSRTLQPEGYGQMIYALSIAGFLTIICDYGFSWTALQAAAAHRDDVPAVRRIFTAVMMAKFLLFIGCVVTFAAAVLFVHQLQQHWVVYAFGLVSTFGAVVFPSWLFQALQKMTQLAWLSIGGRAVAVVAIFSFVHSPSDVWLAVLIQGIPFSGVAAIFLAREWLGRRFGPLSWPEVWKQFRGGWRVFASTLTINVYTTAQTIIVGTLGGVTAAGYFGAADKCLAAAKGGFGVLGQSALPQIAYMARHQPEAGIKFITRLLWTFPIGLGSSVAMYWFAEPISRLLFGSAFVAGVVPLFHILSPVPLILNFSICFASLFMFNYGFQRQWSYMLFGACAVSLLTFGVLYRAMPIEQVAAVAVLLSEGFVMVVSAWYFVKSMQRNLTIQ